MAPSYTDLLSTLAVYDYLGCWKDGVDSSFLPEIGFLSLNDQSSPLHKCARAAALRGIPVFGIKNNSVCVGSVHALLTYMRYGRSTQCYNGIGGPRSMDVYSMDGKAACSRSKNKGLLLVQTKASCA